jgi:hypothetical protein
MRFLARFALSQPVRPPVLLARRGLVQFCIQVNRPSSDVEGLCPIREPFFLDGDLMTSERYGHVRRCVANKGVVDFDVCTERGGIDDECCLNWSGRRRRAASGGALERRKMARGSRSRTAASIEGVLRVRLCIWGRQRYGIAPREIGHHSRRGRSSGNYSFAH